MAKGRIIVNAIAADKRVNALSDDTSRLAFTWLITFADREGRTYGDPAMVRSMLFPRRTDVTTEQVECYISEWAQAGLIVWYEAGGDQWIFFPAFEKHQKGFDSRHEPQSTVPAPPDIPTDIVRTMPVQCTSEMNRIEKKRSESNLSANFSNLPSATPKVDDQKQREKVSLTPTQRQLTALWNVKRPNSTQLQLIEELTVAYGHAKVVEAAKWAHTENMQFGHALNSIKSALPKWGRNGDETHRAGHRPGTNGTDPGESSRLSPDLQAKLARASKPR